MYTNLYNILNKTVKQTVDTLGPESLQNKMFNFSAVIGFNWKWYTVAVSWGLYAAARSIPSVSVPVVTPCSVPLVQVNPCQQLSRWLSLSNQQWKQISKRHHSDCSAKQKANTDLITNASPVDSQYERTLILVTMQNTCIHGTFLPFFSVIHFYCSVHILSPSISSLH